jgi:hypothetical protein
MANNDNAMTRFLFAILKQKNLKDVSLLGYSDNPLGADRNGRSIGMR